MNRRNFLQSMTASAIATAFPTVTSAWGVNQTRHIKLYNVNTGEKIDAPYWRNGYYDQDGILELTKFFRDWRANKVHHIDTDLFELIYAIQTELGLSENGLHLISGYRSKQTNDWLRKRGGKSTGVGSRSLHMKGLAADIRSPDVRLSQLKNTARSLGEGGVGYYPKSQFVHIDVGNKRNW